MSFRRRIVLLSGLAAAIAVAGVSIVTYVLVRNELRDRVDTELRRDVTETFDVPLLSSSDPPALEIRRSADGGRSELVPAGGTGPNAAARLYLPSGPLGGRSVYAQLVDADGPVIRPKGPRTDLPAIAEAREVARRRPRALLLRVRDRRLAPARLHGADRARPCDPGRSAAGRGRRHTEPARRRARSGQRRRDRARRRARLLRLACGRRPGRAPAPRGRAGRDHPGPQPQDRRRGHATSSRRWRRAST